MLRFLRNLLYNAHVVFIAALLLLGAVAFTAWSSLNDQIEAFGWVARTHEVLAHLEEARRGLETISTEVRGFVIAGKEESLAGVQLAAGELQQHLAKLRELAKKGQVQQDALLELTTLVEKRLERVGRVMSVRQTQGTSAAIAFVAEGTGTRQVLELRKHIASMIEREQALLRAREERAALEVSTTRLTLKIGLAAVLGLLILVHWLRSREIRDREVAERRAALAGDRLKGVLDAATHASIIATDLGGRIIMFNPGAERMLGYSAAEMLCSQTPALIHLESEVAKRGQELTARFGRPIQGFGVFVELAKQGQSEVREWTYVRKDGSRLKVELAVTAIRDREGNIEGFLGIATDITARREAEEQYRDLFENAGDLIQSVSPDGRLQYANHAWRESLGYGAQEDISNLSIFDVVAPESLPHCQTVFHSLMSGGKEARVEAVFMSRSGERIWVEGSVSCRFRDGKPMSTRGIFRDITARRDAENALKESEALVRSVLNTVVDGIVTFGENGRIESANPAAAMLFGYTSDEMREMRFETLFPQFAESEAGEEYRQLLAHEACVLEMRREAIGRRKDSTTFPADLGISQLRLTGHRLFTGIIRDITERKQVDRMKNEFISTVSHELRTPLTSIRGSLGLVAGGIAGALSDQARTLVDIAVKNCDRLVRLINDILDIEKISSGKMIFEIRPVELEPLLEQAVEANRAYAEPLGVSYRLESAVDGALVSVDTDRLMQVLANLMSNAAKFSPRGETVTLRAERNAGSIRISVIDRGSGIPQEFRGRIFQRFAQADGSDAKQKGGTGLGLSISKAIVERLGGSIGFDSTLGAGTTFFFDLPEAKKVLPADKPQLSPASKRRGRVLICEDEPDIRKLLRMMLEADGFEIDEAGSAREARTKLAAEKYDLLTLDLKLPDESGLVLFRDLRQDERTRYLPVVVISVAAEEGKLELNGDAFLIEDWLGKPIDQDRLLQTVRRSCIPGAQELPRVLHVEDDDELAFLTDLLLQDVCRVTRTRTLADALATIESESYDLVLLDLGLPDGNGIDLVPRLSAASRRPVPIVIFSAQEVDRGTAEQVAAVLIKSKTSQEDLVGLIRALVREGPSPSGADGAGPT